MDHRSLAYASYWRNSLADAELGRGALKRRDVTGLTRIPRQQLFKGVTPADLVRAWFAEEPEHVKTVEVMIRPQVHVARTEHGQRPNNGVPEYLTPLVTPGLLARDGRLYPAAGTTIPRDLLEPLEHGSFAIGNVDDLDTFLTTDAVPGIEWNADANEALDAQGFEERWLNYRKACQRLLEAVCAGRLVDNLLLELVDHAFLVKKDSVQGAARRILALYDHMRNHRRSTPLFDRYASEAIDPIEPCLPAHALFSTRLGHASDAFALAALQRDALNHLLAARESEILAINGPPGTGKTTLLLSVVATLWAQAALEKGEPPFIVAASTNNQAVTNIIDAFGRDFASGSGPLAGRWPSRITSFGAYFPSRRREQRAARRYQTRDFFLDFESESNLQQAEREYLHAAATAFPELQLPDLAVLAEKEWASFCEQHRHTAASPSRNTFDERFRETMIRPLIQRVVDRLHAQLSAEIEKLRTIESAWKDVVQARESVLAELGEDPAAARAARLHESERLEALMRDFDVLRGRWEEYCARESIFYALFAWLPPVARKRLRVARLFLKDAWPAGFAQQPWTRFEQIEPAIEEIGAGLRADLVRQQQMVWRAESLLDELRQCEQRWDRAVEPLLTAPLTAPLDLAQADALADQRIRFQIFLLATHYWEGRWLLEMGSLLNQLEEERKKTGASARTRRWRRWMKLTPCIVSTFHMLPSLLEVSRYEGNNTYVDDYMYNFADLLIVDEAGQVLPEVAGASFALAKRALVIGDTLQIEPMWSQPRQVDIGNLLREKLLPDNASYEPFQRLCEIGKTASAGSVMRIAQCATRYHQVPELPRGLFLFEHRRCFNEIIRYCNELCYRGKLVPVRGTKADALQEDGACCDRLPAMSYLHIDGICQSRGGGSRFNQLEAEVIATWLAQHKVELEAIYRKPLGDIVGVVTPFISQVQAIARACRKLGLQVGSDEGELTVGTVHSLQGAERLVMIFSPVYTKHSDGQFIDKSASMLNVAVSRAKNTFLVFGDMDVFELVSSSSPRGKLAASLFRDDAQELQFHRPVRRDLQSAQASIAQLRDAREHDDFLRDVLTVAAREVHIVSPWIRLDCIRQTGALTAMSDAVRRGVDVRIYTDVGSNTWDRDRSVEQRKVRDLQDTVAALGAEKIRAVLVRKVHSKVVIGDENIYCVGSFNWFSARRDTNGARHETSLVYRGPHLKEEITVMKLSLQNRAAKFGR
ncbi:AAA family ATPase [Steroidobacter sp. S1-65]|uniref:AAA family ATPase n=1 Tax=Steroidobacter gossypii TaxID=2805490 RepID=A0ABS1X2F3_9GAMM|nr:AAA domain-containing protein [Steroidobacter gossypii]MBM0107377.1 AAA family ATPase [Steroidobacter gossypii]